MHQGMYEQKIERTLADVQKTCEMERLKCLLQSLLWRYFFFVDERQSLFMTFNE